MASSDDPSRREGRYDRRELIRRAGVAGLSIGVAGSGFGQAFYGPLRFKGRWLKGDLTIIQWAHFVPAYDKWFTDVWSKNWGQKNDVQVHVDLILNTLLPARAAAEAAAGSGHDLFFNLSPQAQLEDQVIDHVEIVQEVQRKVGKIGVVGKKATYNPKTKKWFAFADNFVPDPVVWRHDYWNGVGIAPSTWDNVRKAAPKLKAAGHPIGIGQSAELDSNMALIAFMMCFGAYVQDAKHRVTIKSKHTIEAVKFMADIFKSGETDEIFGWQPASNNNFLYSGKGSMILNAISATRTPEDLGLPFADQLYIYPIPKGPVQRLGLEHVMGAYSIWKFAQNIPAAKKFMSRRTFRRPRSSWPTSRSTTRTPSWRRSSTTSRPSRARFRSSGSRSWRRPTRTSRAASTRSSRRSRRSTRSTPAFRATRTPRSPRSSASS